MFQNLQRNHLQSFPTNIFKYFFFFPCRCYMGVMKMFFENLNSLQLVPKTRGEKNYKCLPYHEVLETLNKHNYFNFSSITA